MSRTELNFLNWGLGHEARWPVRVESAGTLPAVSDEDGEPAEGAPGNAPATAANVRRWVEVIDGPELVAILQGRRLALAFPSLAHEREARRWLKATPQPFAAWLELNRSPDSHGEGELCFLRTASPGALQRSPSILIDPSLFANESMSLPALRSALTDDSVLVAPGQGTLLVVSVPTLLGTEATGGVKEVTVYLSKRRKKLVCRLEGIAGKEHLVAVGEPTALPPEVRDCRFIRVPAPPRFVTDPADVELADLAALRPRTMELLQAWLAYETLARDWNVQRLAERQSIDLEYDSVEDFDPASGAFRVSLVNAAAALDHWLAPEVDRRRRQVNVKASVEVYPLDKAERPLEAALEAFVNASEEQGRAAALLKFRRPEGTPPARGRLHAVASRGDERQRKRRERALQRLRQGCSACPDLIRYLLDPGCVPPVERAAYRPRPGAPPLLGNQPAAVAGALQERGIFLIQGPPGTGKTTVLVEIIHGLRRKYRSHRDAEGQLAPLRILVSSVQNEAVRNALEKLQKEGMEVHHVQSEETSGLGNELVSRAQEMARRLRERLAVSGAYLRYCRLRDFRDSVAAFRRELYSEGLTPVAARRLLGLRDSAEAAALTSALREALADLAGRLERALEGEKPAETPPGEGAGGRLTGLLARLGKAAATLGAKDVVGLMEALSDVVTAADEVEATAGAAVDDEARVLAANAARLLARLRKGVARPDALARAAELWGGLRDQITGWLERLSAAPEVTPGSAGTDLSWAADDVLAWVHRAAAHLDEELAGLSERQEAILHDWLRVLEEEPGELRKLLARHCPVTTATCQRAENSEPGADPDYDVAIIDEAGRAGLDVLIPMTLARSVVLIGDHKQLPPHVEEDLLRQMDREILEQVDLKEGSLFQWLQQRLPASNFVPLTMQFRMHEDIGRVVSQAFYEPEVTLEHFFRGPQRAEHEPRFGLCEDRPVVWIDTSDYFHEGGKDGRRDAWPCEERNPYEANLIVHLLRQADRTELLRLRDQGRSGPVGVIPFYKQQVELLGDLLRRELDAELFSLIELGSVDSFQGREFPLVLVSMVRSNEEGMAGFLRLPQRMNVAVSRPARVILVGDSRTLTSPDRPKRGSEPLRGVLQTIKSGGGLVVPSRRVLS